MFFFSAVVVCLLSGEICEENKGKHKWEVKEVGKEKRSGRERQKWKKSKKETEADGVDLYYVQHKEREREKREMSLKRCVLFWGEIESGGTVRDTSLRTGGT